MISAPGEILGKKLELLKFNFGAGSFELFLSFFSSVLGSSFNDLGRSGFNEFLGIG